MQAGAIVIEPRRPPVAPRRPASRFRVATRHLWVLHGRLALRAVLLAVAACAAGTAYLAREPIGLVAALVMDTASANFASAGFAV